MKQSSLRAAIADADRMRSAAFTALVEVARKALPADVNAPVA